jgi:DNA-binding winged helix-turn-helix (wHTH) protein
MQDGAAPGSSEDAASARITRLSFDRYVLDLSRGCLLLDNIEVPLRPKTFAVLEFLVENSDRLVSKDDIFAAVWPNLAVTDDTLVQSIGELRRELGADGPRLIKTIPRRGYLIADVPRGPWQQRTCACHEVWGTTPRTAQARLAKLRGPSGRPHR